MLEVGLDKTTDGRVGWNLVREEFWGAYGGNSGETAYTGYTGTIGFTGTTEIKRSDFGLGYGVPAISDEVALDIVAAFIKQP